VAPPLCVLSGLCGSSQIPIRASVYSVSSVVQTFGSTFSARPPYHCGGWTFSAVGPICYVSPSLVTTLFRFKTHKPLANTALLRRYDLYPLGHPPVSPSHALTISQSRHWLTMILSAVCHARPIEFTALTAVYGSPYGQGSDKTQFLRWSLRVYGSQHP